MTPALVVVPEDALLQGEGGSELDGEPQLRLDPPLRADQPGTGLQATLLLTGEGELGETGLQCGPVEHLVRHVVGGGRGDRLRQEALGAVHRELPLRRCQHEAAALGQDVDAGLLLDLAPDLVRAPNQGHVREPLAHRDPGDPGVTVCGAEIVRGLVGVQAEHAHAGLRQLIGRRAAHRAEPGDHDVVPHHRRLRDAGEVTVRR